MSNDSVLRHLDVTVPERGPAVVRAEDDSIAWLASVAGPLRLLLGVHGAVRITGLGVHTGDRLATVREAMGSRAAECAEQFAERTVLGGGIYGFPDWSADREMCLHHEQGHATSFPALLIMACPRSPSTGGAILLGDTRAVLRELPEPLALRFRLRGWSLVRNYPPHIGLSWSTVFGTSDPGKVEALCAVRHIECDWRRDGTLRTIQRRPAVIDHPVSGDPCWFNQIAFFSQWSVPSVDRQVLLEAFGPLGMPFNTGYGDGEILAESDYDTILGTYEQTMVRVRCHPGDVLLVDNILTAHGREPYIGKQEILVALAEPVRSTNWSTG